MEGVADECRDDGSFGLALDFCLFADSVVDSAMHFLVLSLGFIDLTSMLLFFLIGIRWAFPT